MNVFGIILIIAGAASVTYGFVLNNSIEAQLEAVFYKGAVDPGTVWIGLGAGMAVLGIILLIAGSERNGAVPPETADTYSPTTPPERTEILCPHCNSFVPQESNFCPVCGAVIRESRGKSPKNIWDATPGGSNGGITERRPKCGLQKPDDFDLD